MPPKIAEFASTDSVVAGERKTLTCTVSKGDIPLTLVWLKNGIRLPVSGGTDDGINVLSLNTFNSVLTIERVEFHHSAEYTCTATNAAASTSLTQRLEVNGTLVWTLINSLRCIVFFMFSFLYFFQLLVLNHFIFSYLQFYPSLYFFQFPLV